MKVFPERGTAFMLRQAMDIFPVVESSLLILHGRRKEAYNHSKK